MILTRDYQADSQNVWATFVFCLTTECRKILRPSFVSKENLTEVRAYFWVSWILCSWVSCCLTPRFWGSPSPVVVSTPPPPPGPTLMCRQHTCIWSHMYCTYNSGKQFSEGWFLRWSCNTLSKQDTFERQGEHKSQFCRDTVVNKDCLVWAAISIYVRLWCKPHSRLILRYMFHGEHFGVNAWILAFLGFLKNAADFSFHILTSCLISISFK